MEPTLTTTRRFDGFDAERFTEMVQSEMFRALMSRVQDAMRREQETCERGDGELQIRRAQGAVAFGKTIMGLPEMMLAEMKSGPRYQRPVGHKAANRRA